MGLVSKTTPTIVANPEFSRNQQSRLLWSQVVRGLRFVIARSGATKTNDWVRDEPPTAVTWKEHPRGRVAS